MITTVTPNVALDKYFLVPGFALSGVHRVQQALTLPSGKGINVARVLHHYGVPTIATGVVAGFVGQHICRLMDEAGQKHRFIWAVGESRLCLTILDPAANIHTEILEHGPDYSPELETDLEEVIRSLALQSKYVAISGNPPVGTASNMLYRFVHAGKVAGAKVVLDARGEWLKEGVKALPHIIKPNWQEFEELVGPCPTEELAIVRARRLVNTGIELVLITMGADGAIAITDTEVWRITPPQVEVVSAVGCGDALIGGLLAAFVQGLPLVESLRIATAVATSNACHFGAGEFDAQQVETFRQLVVAERI